MPSPRLLSVALLSSAVVLASLTPAAADSPNVPDPYFEWDGNIGYDVQHYDIDVTYDFATGELTGTTAVTLVPTQVLDELSLDLLLDADSVSVDGAPAAFEKHPNKHELSVDPTADLSAGVATTVEVAYSGVPGDIEWRGESNWLAGRREVVTVNQPHMAAWWFPSNDHPSDKATFDIAVTTDADMKVVSNGVLGGREVHDDGTATTRWSMASPMTTYLAYFAAGDFVVRTGETAGIPYYNAVSRLLPPAKRKRALAQLGGTDLVTRWLQDELGPYPFTESGGTGGLVTGLPIGFALENQTRPVYGSWIYRGVVVHELAHQWFGDSVSVERWRDIWINEGFATYMEVRFAEHRGRTTTNRWLHRLYSENGAESGLWDLDIADPGPQRIFDGAVYTRGAMTLAALRNVIGKPDFRRLLRRWVAKHADEDATVPQFEAMAENVSQRSLDAFFDAWLRSGERPPVRATYGL